MNKVEGLHHLAITTADLKGQLQFFAEKLGMELQALYWMHGVENTVHAFMRLNDESSIAFVSNPQIGHIETVMGQTHAGTAANNCAPGAMQHLALRVKNEAELLAMRDRLRTHGVPVIGPIEHGMCQSIYFAGLENMTLELSFSPAPISADAWVDPEVVQLVGLSEEELEALKSPPEFSDVQGAVPQPGVDAEGPHLAYPEAIYERLLQTPDEVVKYSVESEPPVKVNV